MDGTRSHSAGSKGKTKEVPDGTYVIEIRALKALGDPGHGSGTFNVEG